MDCSMACSHCCVPAAGDLVWRSLLWLVHACYSRLLSGWWFNCSAAAFIAGDEFCQEPAVATLSAVVVAMVHAVGAGEA